MYRKLCGFCFGLGWRSLVIVQLNLFSDSIFYFIFCCFVSFDSQLDLTTNHSDDSSPAFDATVPMHHFYDTTIQNRRHCNWVAFLQAVTSFSDQVNLFCTVDSNVRRRHLLLLTNEIYNDFFSMRRVLPCMKRLEKF